MKERSDEDKENVIRTSEGLMVPEVRASIRTRVSNLQPLGLPRPGKTTQGFRESMQQRDSKPKSFRTVRNFWRRLEGGATDTTPPTPRRFKIPVKKPVEIPALKKISVARKSSKKLSLKGPESLKITTHKRSLGMSSTPKISLKGSSEKKTLTAPINPTNSSIREEDKAQNQSIESASGKKIERSPTIDESRMASLSNVRLSSKKDSTDFRESDTTSSTQLIPDPEKSTKYEHEEEGVEEEESEGEIEEEEYVTEDQASGMLTAIQTQPQNTSIRQPRNSSGTGQVSSQGTALLRPSDLWAALPRLFSDESFNRPSVILPVLLEEEKLFHELVAGGDVNSVSDFLKKRPRFNINCANYQGTSALHIAVKDDNEDMVQFLLSLPNVEVGDSHLFAIRDNHPGVLRMILDKLQSMNPALEFMACSNSPEFADNVTPLILAAEAGHYEIIGLLLSRGHVIPRPHKPRCFCKQECQAILKTQDHLSVSSGKLHIYRALSNPAYMCLTTSDPLLMAFKLSSELLTCGHIDTIYMRQYEALSESLRNFAVDLIAECRTLEEVETILSESKDCKLKGDWMYPRLIVAMDFKQKEFVAHPNVQHVLERCWIGDWLEWRGYRVYVKALYVIPRLISLPVILGTLMFSPASKWAKHYSLPVNKLLSNVASYLIFLLLVFIQSNVDKKNQTKDNKPTGVEIFLVLYVLTFLYNSIRSLIRQGYRRFFKFMWNIYEFIMEFFFIMAFIFLIVAEIKTTLKGDKTLERKYWNYWDPELVSESFFVLATVMAFMRILLIFQISYHLGPLQVSLGKMTNDCAMFSVIFGIIIIAFTAGLCRFYAYYEDMVQTNPVTGEVQSTQESSFTSVLDTFKTLFWGLFSMSSYDVADVVIENIPDEKGNSTVLNEHHLTEAVGYFAFAMYMILTVIVILNMLIATMSNTFQKVTDNLDTEWVFGRTEVYMSYIDLPVLPPPFNIVPTTHTLVGFFRGNKTTGYNLMGKDVEKGAASKEKNIEEYYILMSQLVQRYFSTKNSENE